MSEGTAAEALAELRREIDRLDAGMHGLLMERGRIIDRLIATKGGSAAGSAFRPEREAAMMRVLAARHVGRLPFDAPEAIWRVIISTFTHVQAPFRCHAELSAGDAAMRDSARFHFGFTVPLATHPEAGAAITALEGSRGDLGLVAVGTAAGAWWRALEGSDSPKVIARLPFTERPNHPASLPVLVLAKGVSGEGLGAVRLYAAGRIDDAALDGCGATVLARTPGGSLVSAPAERDAASLEARLGPLRPVGSHPAPVAV